MLKSGPIWERDNAFNKDIKSKDGNCEESYDNRDTIYSENNGDGISTASGSQKNVIQFLYSPNGLSVLIQQMQDRISTVEKEITRVTGGTRKIKDKLDGSEQNRISTMEKEDITDLAKKLVSKDAEREDIEKTIDKICGLLSSNSKRKEDPEKLTAKLLKEFSDRFREYNLPSKNQKEVSKKLEKLVKILSVISYTDGELAKNIFANLDLKMRRDMLMTGDLTDDLSLYQIEMDGKGFDKIIEEFIKFHEASENKAKSFRNFYYCEYISGNKKMEPWMLYYFLFAFETKNEKLQKLDGFDKASLPSSHREVFIYYAAKFVPNMIVSIPITSFGVKFFLEPLINNELVKYSWKATLVNGLVATFASALIKVLLVWIEKNFIKSQKRYSLAKLQEKAAKNAEVLKEAEQKTKPREGNKITQDKALSTDTNTSVDIQNNQQNNQRSHSICLSLDKKSKPVPISEVHKRTESIRFIYSYSKEKKMEQREELGQVFAQLMKKHRNETTGKSKTSNDCNETNSGNAQEITFIENQREIPCGC